MNTFQYKPLLPSKTIYPIPDQNGQIHYLFSDKNGPKTLSFGAAKNIYGFYRGVPSPPPPGRYGNLRLAPWKGIQRSLAFWIPRRGFQIQSTGFQSLPADLGFWFQIFIQIRHSLSCKGVVKKYGGRSREGVGHEVLSLVQAVGLAIFRYPQGVGHPILLHRWALTIHETVDHTCYIKHSQLELLLYPHQPVVQEDAKGDRPHIHAGVKPYV